MIYFGAKRGVWDYAPWIPKADLQAGDVWVGDGKSWNTELPTKDMDESVLLLERSGEWAWVAT